VCSYTACDFCSGRPAEKTGEGDQRVSRQAPCNDQVEWHIADLGLREELEITVKLVAMAMGIATLLERLPLDFFFSVEHVFPFWLLSLVSVGHILMIGYMWLEKEILSLALFFCVLIGHWVLLLAAVSQSWPGMELRAFALLMATGDALKLLSLVKTDVYIRDLPYWAPRVVTGIFLFSYLLLAFTAT